jgi:hypothetical protein
MQDLSKIRLELSTHTNIITMFLNLWTVGSLGKVEEHMISYGEELKAVRRSVNWVTASMQANAGQREGSILTSYANDGKAFWKDFRRELVKEGYSSSVLRKHKTLIRDYVKELGDRGALDEVFMNNTEEGTIHEEQGSVPNDSDFSESSSASEDLTKISRDHPPNHTHTTPQAAEEETVLKLHRRYAATIEDTDESSNLDSRDESKESEGQDEIIHEGICLV